MSLSQLFADFLMGLRIRRMQRKMRERLVLLAIFGIFMLCCCMTTWVGMVNYTLRDVLHILPTLTPSLVPTPTPDGESIGFMFDYLLAIK